MLKSQHSPQDLSYMICHINLTHTSNRHARYFQYIMTAIDRHDTCIALQYSQSKTLTFRAGTSLFSAPFSSMAGMVNLKIHKQNHPLFPFSLLYNPIGKINPKFVVILQGVPTCSDVIIEESSMYVNMYFTIMLCTLIHVHLFQGYSR